MPLRYLVCAWCGDSSMYPAIRTQFLQSDRFGLHFHEGCYKKMQQIAVNLEMEFVCYAIEKGGKAVDDSKRRLPDLFTDRKSNQLIAPYTGRTRDEALERANRELRRNPRNESEN